MFSSIVILLRVNKCYNLLLFPELLVIGVHSAKFENEKNTENIGNAASRQVF